MKLEIMAVSISVFGLVLIGKAMFEEQKKSHGHRLNTKINRMNALDGGERLPVAIKKKDNKYLAQTK